MTNNPKATIIWSGAILGTIAKSIATAIDPQFDIFQSWSGSNYTVQGNDGRYGAISFQGPQGRLFHSSESSVVGAFYSVKSNRCPLADQAGHAALEAVFRGCPETHRHLAEKGALQFLLFEIHPGGPCATAAFWNVGDYLFAAESWDAVLKNGAEIIQRELIEDVEKALGAWAEEYHLSEQQIDFARAVYQRKMNAVENDILLTSHESAYLASLSNDPNAIQVCRTSFADIGILIA